MKGFFAALARFLRFSVRHPADSDLAVRGGEDENLGARSPEPADDTSVPRPSVLDLWGFFSGGEASGERFLSEDAAPSETFAPSPPSAEDGQALDRPDDSLVEARSVEPETETSVEAPSKLDLFDLLTGAEANNAPGAPPEYTASQLLLPKYAALPKLSGLPKRSELPKPTAPVRPQAKPCRVLDLLDRVAALDGEVLITGPAGTGKTRYAQYLHQRSHRADRAFIPVPCAGLRKEGIETALFGLGDGVRTAAQLQNGGLVAKAEGGTLFLDDVDRLPLAIQIKLLRLLQEKQYRPLGASRLKQANLRIVAATNADVTDDKPFLQEFLRRLRMTVVETPALVDRHQDIPFLLEAFAAAYADAYHLPCLAFSDGALQRLCAYSWPGNLRELETCVKYLTCLRLTRPVDARDLPLPMADAEPELRPELKMLAEAAKLAPVDLDLPRLFARVALNSPPGFSNGAFDAAGMGRKGL